MAKITTYRTCFVPLCTNTTKSAPDKAFATVPQDPKLRKKWFDAVRRDNLKNSKSNFFCCEDHFNLREDMENYLYYTIMGGPLKIKKDVVPHKFECQPDRKRRTCPVPRPTAEKRRRRMEVDEMLTTPLTNPVDATQQTTARQSVLKNLVDLTTQTSTELTNMTNPMDAMQQTTAELNIWTNQDATQRTPAELNIQTNPMDATQRTTAELTTTGPDELLTDNFFNYSLETFSKRNIVSRLKDAETQTLVGQRSIGVQVNIRPHYRSIRTMCNIPVSTIVECTSPIKLPVFADVATSPTKPSTSKKAFTTASVSTNTTTSIGISSSDYYVPSEHTSVSDPSSPSKNARDILNVTNYFISTNMKAYLGIPNEWSSLLHLLSVKGNTSIQNVQLCLMKIRRQDTFERLAEQFCMSTSNASIIFSKTLPIISHLLKTLIFFPNPDSVKKTLPIAFRNSYSHVQSIVDAFEIQIEKPNEPVNQALTWSEYKKCNTLKYLISCGPDGFINFVSTGYGGRISDVLLFEKCGILEKLPQKCAVMADRGFKNIKSLLAEKQLELIKPPSVSSTVKPTKSEVLETKRIASLRIHIERVIGRLREFDFLKPHAVISHSMLSYTDDIVTIAAALVNLHSPIIKK